MIFINLIIFYNTGDEMDIKQLKTFVKICNDLSFSKAANALGYSQPTVTMHIQLLESELNVKLFERLGHMVKPTTEGKQLLYYADKILAYSNQATHFFTEQQETEKKIIIGANQSFGVAKLPFLLKSFIKKYPTTDIQLKFGNVQEIRDGIKENTIDIAFFLTKNLNYTDLIIENLHTETASLVVSLDHPFAKRKRITFTDLNAESLIITEKNCLYRSMIDEILSIENVKPRTTIETNNVQAIKELVLSGLGIAILPQSTIEHELEKNLLIKIPLPGFQPTVSTQIAYHKNKWLSPILLKFLERSRQVYLK